MDTHLAHRMFGEFSFREHQARKESGQYSWYVHRSTQHRLYIQCSWQCRCSWVHCRLWKCTPNLQIVQIHAFLYFLPFAKITQRKHTSASLNSEDMVLLCQTRQYPSVHISLIIRSKNCEQFPPHFAHSYLCSPADVT
jgi:hypothetical protein